MRKLTIVAVIVGFVLGCVFGGSALGTAYAQFTQQSGKIAPGVYASEFPNGTVCYTNNAGGIFCMR